MGLGQVVVLSATHVRPVGSVSVSTTLFATPVPAAPLFLTTMVNRAESGGVIEPPASVAVSGFLTRDRFGQLTVVVAVSGAMVA